MKRLASWLGRALVIVMLTAAFGASSAMAQTVASAAAQPHKPYRIYMALWRGWEEAAQGFKDYFASQHVPVEFIVRNANQDESKLKDFVAEAKSMDVDLVFTWGTSVSLGMLGSGDHPDPDRFITNIPAVFAIVSQPVGTRLVPNLAGSGRNITGTTYLVPVSTQISLIQSYRPLHKLGMVYNPLERNSLVAIDEINAIAEKSDFTLVALPVDVVDGKPNASSIPDKVASLKEQGVDFLYIPPDTFMNLNRDVLTTAAEDAKIPSFAAAENPVMRSKAMMGGVYRYYTVGQMTAYKALRILQGKAKPGDIPIEAPKRLSIMLNMPVVRSLGVYPPMKLVGLAEIIDNEAGR